MDVRSGIMLLQFLSAYVHVSDTAGAWMRRTLTGRKWLKAYGTSFPAAIVDVLSGFMLLRILSAYIRVGDTAGAGMGRTLTGRKWLLTSGTSFPAATHY